MRSCECGCGASMEGRDARARYATDACRARAWKDENAYGPQVPPEVRSNGSDDDPQWLQFLRMLRAAGDHGVHTFEMRRAFIGNPSQRRQELIDRGCHLRVSEREKLHGRALGVRYFLEYEPEGIGAPAVSPGPVPREAGHISAGSTGPDPSSDRTLSPPAAGTGPDENAGALFDAPAREHRPSNALLGEAA